LKRPEIINAIDYVQKGMFVGRCVSNCVPQRICVTCGGTAYQFSSEKQAKEYRLSGMCQKCQEGVFKGG
jgi:hypothetical protein